MGNFFSSFLRNIWGAKTPFFGGLFLIAVVILTCVAYVLVCDMLRNIFRKHEKDVALVTLNISFYPGLLFFILTSIFVAIQHSNSFGLSLWIGSPLLAGIICVGMYWCIRIFKQVFIYYLKEYSETTEVMWDEVLIPLLEGIVPTVIIILGASAILQFCFKINLAGIWVTLGGGAFIIGLAARDILANFFSGIVLLLDSPFQFGDVIKIEDPRRGKSEMGILRQIGIRVTHLYMFESHTEMYIPNSVVQVYKITNLSRPLESMYISRDIELRADCNLELAKKTMQEIVLAHPDTLGNIDKKIACLNDYYNWEESADTFLDKKKNGQQRLLLEGDVNNKLEEIESALEALILTLQFLEKGGLDADDVETIQLEYDTVLELIGVGFVRLQPERKSSPWDLSPRQKLYRIEETKDPDSLINLVREWYRVWLRDPNVVDKDQYVLSEIWERKIELLKKRTFELYELILNPFRAETRLDDYIRRLVKWLKDRFKQARSEWQDPDVRMHQVIHISGKAYIRFSLNYYVDDIRLEDGERGMRVSSDIYREIMNHLQDFC